MSLTNISEERVIVADERDFRARALQATHITAINIRKIGRINKKRPYIRK